MITSPTLDKLQLPLSNFANMNSPRSCSNFAKHIPDNQLHEAIYQAQEAFPVCTIARIYQAPCYSDKQYQNQDILTCCCQQLADARCRYFLQHSWYTMGRASTMNNTSKSRTFSMVLAQARYDGIAARITHIAKSL